jgi:multiple antibiotic resistance protein
MLTNLIQLIILFVVIIDPLASLAVFYTSTNGFYIKEKYAIAIKSIGVAFLLLFVFLIFGDKILVLFNTDINKFRIAGGIILTILGTKMALGKSITDIEEKKGNSDNAIASIIATPLLCGPASITATIISKADYGFLLTFIAMVSVILLTGLLFYLSIKFRKLYNKTFIQLSSTILGLITLAWGVEFIIVGISSII